MNLQILLPHKVFLNEEVTKIVAEAENGAFCLLPKHVDFLASLAPSILAYTDVQKHEVFTAVDEGILVKCGSEVLVSTRRAVRGLDIGMLQRTIEDEYLVIDEHERIARAAAARLEADLVRRFVELHQHAY